jgi:hypothetical protein
LSNVRVLKRHRVHKGLPSQSICVRQLDACPDPILEVVEALNDAARPYVSSENALGEYGTYSVAVGEEMYRREQSKASDTWA